MTWRMFLPLFQNDFQFTSTVRYAYGRAHNAAGPLLIILTEENFSYVQKILGLKISSASLFTSWLIGLLIIMAGCVELKQLYSCLEKMSFCFYSIGLLFSQHTAQLS
jgi:hypothetical protein